MYSFRNDYSEIAHKNILDALSKYASEQNVGYGLDSHSSNARKLIRKQIDRDIDVDVRFLIGGTSCNKIVISHVLRPFEAVIAATTGHINVHEAGAIEASGHKVITVPSHNGKLLPADITKVVHEHVDEHMVVPKMVYISNATETGSIYTKAELTAISKVCHVHNLILYVDGARLGAALTAIGNDLTINDIAQLTDLFYIGGTKNGTLFGEALVIVNDDLKNNFRHSIKQNGGMLAKGFITG
ncbi:MAG TPA: threonine aldolase, partial [Lactobacillus acetotolerans]|nr:threonine aldolase [Lactobacillus acetotolerans]